MFRFERRGASYFDGPALRFPPCFVYFSIDTTTPWTRLFGSRIGFSPAPQPSQRMTASLPRGDRDGGNKNDVAKQIRNRSGYPACLRPGIPAPLHRREDISLRQS